MSKAVTVRALYKNNPTFGKGPSCSYAFEVRVLFEDPLNGRAKGDHEEDGDVRGGIRGPRQPFLFLSRTIRSRSSEGFVLAARTFMYEENPTSILERWILPSKACLV